MTFREYIIQAFPGFNSAVRHSARRGSREFQTPAEPARKGSMEILSAVWIVVIVTVGVLVFSGRNRAGRYLLKQYKKQRPGAGQDTSQGTAS